jgi:hypothetical protein
LSKETKHTEFEALKNVWKQHYAEVKALKKERKAAVRSATVQRALNGVEASLSRLGLTFNEIDSLGPTEFSNSQEHTGNVDKTHIDSGLEKAITAKEASKTQQIKAKESLEIIKNEMGLINDEINKRARASKTSKTIGRQ